MVQTEKHWYGIVHRELLQMRESLIRGESISMTLFALSHVKDKRIQVETLQSVHNSLAKWPLESGKHEIARDILRKDKIIQYGLQTIREPNPSYDETIAVEKSEVQSKKSSSSKNTRGPAQSTILIEEYESSARKCLQSEEEEDISRLPLTRVLRRAPYLKLRFSFNESGVLEKNYGNFVTVEFYQNTKTIPP